ncbi:hypothetical protein DY000_02046324 [Brassica cretica]|uniref:Uncharacterized protein n=1 Tax=Brassica cretica TaxID=69181 RepID=A0ABQ7ETH2_BRACR|nr:hypothetical protein DY000_02046324 [Brassica cretica]
MEMKIDEKLSVMELLKRAANLLDLFSTTMIVAASSTPEEKLLGMLYLVRRSAKICQNRLVDSVNFLFIASLTRQSFYKLFYAVVILVHGEEEDGKGIWNQRSVSFILMHSENSNGNGVLYTGLYVGLICVGNVVKWVVYVVSYHACRTRVSEKKDDEDQNLRLLLHRNCI